MKFKRMITPVVLLSCMVSSVHAENTISNALKEVFITNLNASEREDIDAVMATLHTQSPSYQQTQQVAQTLSQNFDLKFELLSFKYIGRDGEYAVARAKQLAVKQKPWSKSGYQDNETDMIHVFRQENGRWKIWSSAILTMKTLNQ